MDKINEYSMFLSGTISWPCAYDDIGVYLSFEWMAMCMAKRKGGDIFLQQINKDYVCDFIILIK